MSEATKTKAPGGRPAGIGGRRLASAFEVVSELPALAEARRRLLGACQRPAVSPGDLAGAVEADAGLAIAVMRAANNGGGPPNRIAGVREAVVSLKPEGVSKVATAVETYDVLDHPGALTAHHERFRRHAVDVRHATEVVADLARLPQAEELAVAALLHDVGRLVLMQLYGDESEGEDGAESPDVRVRRERRQLGIDHALVGGVLLRRWGLPGGVASAVERHHAPDASGHAAAIRLGDMLVHFCSGDRVPPESLREGAAALGISDEKLSALVFDYPWVGESKRRPSDPCPLSARELDALRGLAEGKVYKQIAQELTLSVSTVRTHLHNVYRKIDAVDRAQAVLTARDRGWL